MHVHNADVGSTDVCRIKNQDYKLVQTRGGLCLQTDGNRGCSALNLLIYL